MNQDLAIYAKLAYNHLGKVELCAKYGSMDIFSIFFPILFLSHPHSTQPKDTH
jgi:hypothetical protein